MSAEKEVFVERGNPTGANKESAKAFITPGTAQTAYNNLELKLYEDVLKLNPWVINCHKFSWQTYATSERTTDCAQFYLVITEPPPYPSSSFIHCFAEKQMLIQR